MEHEYVGGSKIVSIQLWVYGIFSGGDRRLVIHKNADSFHILRDIPHPPKEF
jgi:hypothetical protein